VLRDIRSPCLRRRGLFFSLAAIGRTHESHDVETPSVKPGALENLDPHIELSEEHGTVEIRDRRLFRRGHEAFCRRLVELAARQPGIRSASVALGSVTCRLEFDTGWRSAECMARRFAVIMDEAIPELGRDGRLAPGEIEWATVSAFPAGEAVSCWEIIHEASDRLRLHNEILRLDSSLARGVAKALREVPGIVSSRVVSFEQNLRIAYDPSQRAALAVVDAAENCLRSIRLSKPHLPDPDKRRNRGQIEGQSQLWFQGFAMRLFALAALCGSSSWRPSPATAR